MFFCLLAPDSRASALNPPRLLESGIAAGGAGAVKKAYVLCALLFSAVSLKTAIENQYFYTTNNIGTSTRGVLSTVSEGDLTTRCQCRKNSFFFYVPRVLASKNVRAGFQFKMALLGRVSLGDC